MKAYANYLQQQLSDSSPEDLLLQLMNGAIVKMHQARESWQDGLYERARELRCRALDIVMYLQNTLDRDKSPDIADQLDPLYTFMIQELNRAALEDDFERLQPVQDILETMYRGWQEAVAEYKSSFAPPQSSARQAVAAL